MQITDNVAGGTYESDHFVFTPIFSEVFDHFIKFNFRLICPNYFSTTSCTFHDFRMGWFDLHPHQRVLSH